MNKKVLILYKYHLKRYRTDLYCHFKMLKAKPLSV